ncbi:MAG: hypothetical protein CXR30_09090 [Geobacter sp.]|nr:MAG: hypothetical protein CXR30_09090 [Geobacter sp.]
MTLTNHTIRTLGMMAILLSGIYLFAGKAESATAPVVSTLAPITEGVSTPVRLATDLSGNIYVSDPRGGGIHKYSNAGKLLQTIATANDVLGIAIAQNGDLLASQGTYVAAFDKNSGALLSKFGTFGKANGIAVAGNGFVYVTDSVNNCVQVFNAAYAPVTTGVAASGLPVNSFGSAGRAAGQFTQPTGISYEKISNQLAVADTLNGRIEFFSTSGVYQSTLGTFGAGPLLFSSPEGVAFEYSANGQSLSRIYVVDSYQSIVQAIDAATSTFLRNIGGYGTTSGKLVVPADVLYDPFDPLNNRLLVANGTGTVALFAIDSTSAGQPASGPALVVNAVPTVTNLNTIIIDGTTASGATVTVNGIVATVTGTSWTSTVPLTSGINVITISATDSSGTTTQTVSVNAQAPAVNQVSLTITPFPTLTTASSITLTGTVDVGGAVTANSLSATVTGNSWSVTVPLSQGANSFQIIASKAGMNNSTATVNITMDNIAPVLTAYMLQNNSTSSTPVQTISGTVTDTGATSVTVTINGTSQTIPVTNGTFSMAAVLNIGANTVSVTATDAAGNSSAPAVSNITYDPQAPLFTVTTPNGSASNAPSFTLTGTAPAGSSVTVNNLPVAMSNTAVAKTASAQATLNGTTWTAAVTLNPGPNYFEIVVTDPVSKKSAATAETIAYVQGLPSIAVTDPPQDMATAKSSLAISGTVTAGATVTATVNGTNVPVTVNGTTFGLTLPAFTTPGSYTVNIVATDASGNASTTRTVIYDPIVPVLTVVSSAPLKITATGGVLVAKDKNGPVGNVTIANGTSTLDLSGVTYDSASLNVYALSAAGVSTRNGDLDGNGQLGISDALQALRMASGLVTPTTAELLHGDVAPLVNGVPVPDGVIDIRDALVILRASVGLVNLY